MLDRNATINNDKILVELVSKCQALRGFTKSHSPTLVATNPNIKLFLPIWNHVLKILVGTIPNVKLCKSLRNHVLQFRSIVIERVMGATQHAWTGQMLEQIDARIQLHQTGAFVNSLSMTSNLRRRAANKTIENTTNDGHQSKATGTHGHTTGYYYARPILYASSCMVVWSNETKTTANQQQRNHTTPKPDVYSSWP